jgi:hypothetical protein
LALLPRSAPVSGTCAELPAPPSPKGVSNHRGTAPSKLQASHTLCAR